jgi:hypothetical protein
MGPSPGGSQHPADRTALRRLTTTCHGSAQVGHRDDKPERSPIAQLTRPAAQWCRLESPRARRRPARPSGHGLGHVCQDTTDQHRTHCFPKKSGNYAKTTSSNDHCQVHSCVGSVLGGRSEPMESHGTNCNERDQSTTRHRAADLPQCLLVVRSVDHVRAHQNPRQSRAPCGHAAITQVPPDLLEPTVCRRPLAPPPSRHTGPTPRPTDRGR